MRKGKDRHCECGHNVTDHREYFSTAAMLGDNAGLSFCSVPDCGCQTFTPKSKERGVIGLLVIGILAVLSAAFGFGVAVEHKADMRYRGCKESLVMRDGTVVTKIAPGETLRVEGQ